MSGETHYGADTSTGGLLIRIAIPAWRLIARDRAAGGKAVSQQELRSLFREELQELGAWRRTTGRRVSSPDQGAV